MGCILYTCRGAVCKQYIRFRLFVFLLAVTHLELLMFGTERMGGNKEKRAKANNEHEKFTLLLKEGRERYKAGRFDDAGMLSL